ncbi:GTPase Era [Eubacteriales bacterium OttesenSCG-928-M02]|nr:GTPase Era [Eubacteriales bacterium OttesenSCG-928-M02]
MEQNRDMEKGIRSGFIAIVGRPNVGKSSMVNYLVGEKVAIVSNKPQTTRNRIMGVVNGDGYQMVLLDTPGMHIPKTKLGKYMEATATRSMRDVECVLLVLDGKRGVTDFEAGLMEQLQEAGGAYLVCVNKVDLLKGAEKEALFVLVEEKCGKAPYASSATTGEGMDTLLQALVAQLPPGPLYFPPGEVTDMPEEFITTEIIREKALSNLYDEIPHGVGVELEKFMEREDGIVEVQAVLYCEKKSHKGMIIGKNGSMLKKISTEARLNLEELFGAQVFLRIFVKVREDWRDNNRALKDLGYE